MYWLLHQQSTYLRHLRKQLPATIETCLPGVRPHRRVDHERQIIVHYIEWMKPPASLTINIPISRPHMEGIIWLPLTRNRIEHFPSDKVNWSLESLSAAHGNPGGADWWEVELWLVMLRGAPPSVRCGTTDRQRPLVTQLESEWKELLRWPIQ